MRFYPETKRLKDTQEALCSTRLGFAYNKKQELTRLVYELSKINNTSPEALLREAVTDSDFQGTKQAFFVLKDYFLRRRFPATYQNKEESSFYLPKIKLDSHNKVTRKKKTVFYPKRIFIEEDAKDYGLSKSIVKKFPAAQVINIKDLKSYVESKRNKTRLDAYNQRTDNLFLIKERHDFIKPCPCSKSVLRCGYYILNLGFGCIYDCSYCFLQNYANVNAIIIPVNIDDYIKRLKPFLKKHTRPLRIGTGEFTDSLALDDLTDFSKMLIEFFSKDNNSTLELKTKSNNIKNILRLKHNRKTVISWSLNPQSIVDSDEWQTNSLKERLDAAQACTEAGYLVGFHFDPIVYSINWQDSYRELIGQLFKRIDHENIAWISLGTFRFVPKLKTMIEQRFPDSKILDEELVVGLDKKLRYAQRQRIEVYKNMLSWIKRHSNSALVYLCMEPKEIWQQTLGRNRF
ncbi:radical SAM protein [Candidatus Omnitrophota bacterium]